MKLNKYFTIQEFLPPKEFERINKLKTDNEKLEAFYKLVNPKIVELATFYREFFKAPIIINNWSSKGSYTLRGWRPRETKIGAKFSEHKNGRAFDCDVKGLTAEEVRKIILENEVLFYSKGLRRIENLVNWVHSDIKETNLINKIMVFNP